jgi:hypothetical protein
MLVDLKDGSCRSCNGQLEITVVDDATMSVVCLECSDNYDVESDAFGDGCMKYFFPLMAQRDGIGFTGE